ncbi:Imidazolonepropionase [Chitinophaga costaii]|uniref:Imidazolonepropionase n=1 Tax=Chitinophaga costaii TaxID=1335309 RepID=A0A1C4AR86_9BACT|nr:amidohydrolase family protein [Chitinophaga costaii]PUZ26715.1 amidohydrolase [Chitinophaga costaii]SCB97172.1 Imidazolonepropionase [Chitinophaga costaii]
MRMWMLCVVALTGIMSCQQPAVKNGEQLTVIKGVNLIDGNGGTPQTNVALVLRGDALSQILKVGTDSLPKDATVIDATGKTVMPTLINAHGHLGLLKDTTAVSGNYTPENVERQLKKYAAYGVGAVLSMGTDQEAIWRLRDSSRAGKLPGAIIYTAGYGFGVENGGPPITFAGKVFRPKNPQEVAGDMDVLAKQKPDFVKMWVDDFNGSLPKMSASIYDTILKCAHDHGLRVAAHVYYLEDARRLIHNGVDVIAHSIRDKEIDDALIETMKSKDIYYIPTLSLDQYSYAYAADTVPWINDPFFKQSLEPGIYEMITSPAFKAKAKADKDLQKKMYAFHTAMQNLVKIHSAGVKVCMGTDSGAQLLRTQGYSEHLELELMVLAGLTPLQAITCATKNAAEMLQVSKETGTLEPGKKASFIVLDKNPVDDIRNTHTISQVWINGVQQAGL